MRALHDQCDKRENPAFATIVRAHDEYDVLDADYADERPQNERQDTENVGVVRRQAVFRFEALAQRVKRARTDVAIDDTER